MSDTRTVEDLVAMLVTLQTRLDDLESTLTPRIARRPTGDIEPTVRTTPKIDTLILNGQTVARATYPVLWQWVQDNGLVATNLFTVGDGSTTFGLPNFSGRVLIGAGTLGSDSYALGSVTGASTRILSIANLPAHDHNVGVSSSDAGGHSHGFTTDSDGGHSHSVTINAGGSHSHSVTTNSTGSHGGHESFSTGRGTAAPTAQTVTNAAGSAGAHSHTGTTNTESAHTHTGSATSVSGHDHAGTTGSVSAHDHDISVSEDSVGSGTALDVRQPSIAINWLIYV
jgi:microcystin-dependent protein